MIGHRDDQRMHRAVLTIGGSDSGGAAGIQADIKTFSALGVHGASVVTAITAQNTTGVKHVFPVSPEAISAQIEAVLDDLPISWAKTGMLHSAEVVSIVAEAVKGHDLSLVLDPVIEAQAGGRLLDRGAEKALAEELLPLAYVVTPNIFEAQALSGIDVLDTEGALAAGRAILELGASNVVVTGGHLQCQDLLLHGEDVHILEGKRVKGGDHGVGCTFSSALLALLAKGYPLPHAVSAAKSFAVEAIGWSRPLGEGASPVDQLGVLRDEAQRFRILCEMDQAVELLLAEPALHNLIPEVGSNIGMGTSMAVSALDVAAVSGRLVRSGRLVKQTGPIRFGASSHIARVILAAIGFDSGIRSAMNIRLSKAVLRACTDLELCISSFDRSEEPTGMRTMSWGTAKAIEACGRVPQVVWDPGGYGKEPMVRLLGESASVVASMAIDIARLAG